jgi:hypothetical protein
VASSELLNWRFSLGTEENIENSHRIQLVSWLVTELDLLTYSMVHSPSWETNWFAASQEIHCISRNPKVHYRTHKSPPPVPILGQPNPVHITTSHLLVIHPNIIHPTMPRSLQWSLSLRFPPPRPYTPPSPVPHTRYMPRPSHSSRFYHPNNIGWGVQIIWLLVMQSPPFPRYYFLTLSHKKKDFWKERRSRTQNVCSDFLNRFLWTVSHSKKNQALCHKQAQVFT